MTVKELVDKIIEKTGVTPLPEEKTSDHLMTGSWDMEVKGRRSTLERISSSPMNRPGSQERMIQNGFLMTRFILRRRNWSRNIILQSGDSMTICT